MAEGEGAAPPAVPPNVARKLRVFVPPQVRCSARGARGASPRRARLTWRGRGGAAGALRCGRAPCLSRARPRGWR